MTLPWIETNAFANHVVAITGAGRGIGAGLAERFGQAGATVMVIDLHEDRAEETTSRLTQAGLRAFAIAADVVRPDEVQRLFSNCHEQHGRLDVLVNSAGFAERRSLLDVDEPYWDTTLDVNLKAPFFCLQAAARIMIKQGRGRVINLGSVGSHAAQMDLLAYNSAKGGIVLLGKAAALELAPHGITVNTVAPGGVEGPWNEQFFDDPEYRRRWNATVPMGRMASNDDVAAAVLFLASEESKYITGQTIYIDGGKLSYVPSVEILDQAFSTAPGDSDAPT